MTVPIVAGVITFLFTTLLTIAGVGAAFILIPVFVALGIDIHVAMATALLLNAIAMSFASYRFVRAKLVLWKIAIPILLVATVLSPLGAWVSQGLPRNRGDEGTRSWIPRARHLLPRQPIQNRRERPERPETLPRDRRCPRTAPRKVEPLPRRPTGRRAVIASSIR